MSSRVTAVATPPLLPCWIVAVFTYISFRLSSTACRQIEERVHRLIPLVLAPHFSTFQSPALHGPWLSSRPFHRSHDPIASSSRKRNEFPLGALHGETVFILSACWIWSQRRDPYPTFRFHRLLPPIFWRSVCFRRHPPFYMPSIRRQIFGDSSKLRALSDHAPVAVAICPFPADPGQTRLAPYNAKVRLTQPIQPACLRHSLLNVSRRLMRLARHSNQVRPTPEQELHARRSQRVCKHTYICCRNHNAESRLATLVLAGAVAAGNTRAVPCRIASLSTAKRNHVASQSDFLGFDDSNPDMKKHFKSQTGPLPQVSHRGLVPARNSEVADVRARTR